MQLVRLISGLLPGVVFALIVSQFTGCAVVAVGAAGTAAGVTMVHDRRTPGTFLDDEYIEWKINQAVLDNEKIGQHSHINVTSYNNIVLLTGEISSEKFRTYVEKIALKVPKVRRVYNELAVAAPSSYLSRSSDAIITAKIKAILLSEHSSPAARIKVVTENGTVYLLGLVKDSEASWATEKTRIVGGVQRVVKLFEFF